MRDTELKRMQDKALYDIYVQGLEAGAFSNMQQAVDYARHQPAPQFYISARTASLYIGRIMSNISLIDLNEQSRRRIWTLHDQYVAYRKAHPNDEQTRERILEDLVEQPAPEFFLGHEAARKIILRERKRARKRYYI